MELIYLRHLRNGFNNLLHLKHFLLYYHYQHHHFSCHCCSKRFSDDCGEDQISIESHQIEYLTGIVSVDWLPRWGRYSTTFHRRYNTPSIWSTHWILLVKVSHSCIAKSDHSVSVPPGFDKWRKISFYETPLCRRGSWINTDRFPKRGAEGASF